MKYETWIIPKKRPFIFQNQAVDLKKRTAELKKQISVF